MWEGPGGRLTGRARSKHINPWTALQRARPAHLCAGASSERTVKRNPDLGLIGY